MRQKHDKTAIIKKGVELFRKNGYHNTGVDDILKACDIPSGSFYNFFKNKEGFAIQALEYYNQQYIKHLDKVLKDEKLDPLQKLKKLFQESVKTHVDNNCSKGCLLNGLTSEVAAINQAIGETAAGHYQINSNKIAGIIKEGQDMGIIRDDLTANELAFYLIDGFAGATVRMQADQSDQPLKLFLKTAFKFL